MNRPLIGPVTPSRASQRAECFTGPGASRTGHTEEWNGYRSRTRNFSVKAGSLRWAFPVPEKLPNSGTGYVRPSSLPPRRSGTPPAGRNPVPPYFYSSSNTAENRRMSAAGHIILRHGPHGQIPHSGQDDFRRQSRLSGQRPTSLLYSLKAGRST